MLLYSRVSRHAIYVQMKVSLQNAPYTGVVELVWHIVSNPKVHAYIVLTLPDFMHMSCSPINRYQRVFE